MRILVLHAWLKGNLGDVLQLSVLLAALRELEPRVLDLAGFPERPADETREILTLVDRYLPDPFPWYWSVSPTLVGKVVFEPWWRRGRKALFSRYDAIVCAPGPYLADYDLRVTSALADITIASELGLPVVLSSHSIGPLQPDELATIAKAAVCIAREPATYHYLCERGMSSVLSADLAFLYPYDVVGARESIAPPYRLVFLRSNNLNANALRLESGALFEGPRLIAEAANAQLVLATSDYRRDQRFLAAAARKLGVSWVCCRSVPELVRLIGASSGVVSDRYHPAICAAALGKPAQVLSNREPHKMQGLKNLLADNTLEELQELARAGLGTLGARLRRSS
jgi:polysaccharide pyruvyl transferase WcaK-like protein